MVEVMQAEIRSRVRKFCEDNGFTNDRGLWGKRGSNWMCYVTIPRGEIPRMYEIDVVYWIMTDTRRYETSMRIQAHLFVEIIEGVLRCCREYQYLGIPVMGCLQYKGFFCTHVPIHPHELDFCRGNIHGHIHRKGVIDGWEYNPQSLGERYFNVNTEFHNYTPVLFDEIEQYFINLKS